MSVPARIQRAVIMTAVAVFGTAVVAFAVLILVKLVAHTTAPAQAASVIYYPNFCLGGWKYPQHASGPAAIGGEYSPDVFTLDNSAYLESSIASQMFCGYFSVRNSKNPPTKATITFNWAFKWRDGNDPSQHPESYTSTGTTSAIVSPTTGFVAATSTSMQNAAPTPAHESRISNTAAVGNSLTTTNTDTVPNTGATTAVSSDVSEPSTTMEVPLIHDTADTVSSSSNQNTTGQSDHNEVSNIPPTDISTTNSDSSGVSVDPALKSSSDTPPTPSVESTSIPVSDPAPAPEPAPLPNPTPESPQSLDTNRSSFGSFISSLIAEKVHAAEIDQDVSMSGVSFHDFLEISYSLDGIRWTPIGRVNKDNWKGYSVSIPVSSWDEVKRLQIMISVLPTIDEKPDVYLDSMSMRAEYNRTMAELAADGLSAVSNAVDTLIGDGNGATNEFEIVPDAPRGPQPVYLRIRKLLFPSVGRMISVTHDAFDDEGRVVGKVASKRITVDSANGDTSMIVSGSCGKKYAVILTYRGVDDYIKHRSSYVINRAQECRDGTFRFDLADLSPETRDGAQYLVVGEQGESGTWEVVSDVVPITITATTTIETQYQQSDQ